jgi:hypothetical protein
VVNDHGHEVIEGISDKEMHVYVVIDTFMMSPSPDVRVFENFDDALAYAGIMVTGDDHLAVFVEGDMARWDRPGGAVLFVRRMEVRPSRVAK